ncbi:hypothetical protein ACET3Z_023844 [Daucus carota]
MIREGSGSRAVCKPVHLLEGSLCRQHFMELDFGSGVCWDTYEWVATVRGEELTMYFGGRMRVGLGLEESDVGRRSETSYNEAEGLMTFKEYCDDNLCISRQKARAKDVKSTQFAYSTPRYCSFEIELVEFTKVPDPGQWSVNCIPCQNIYAHGLNAVFVIKYKV